MTATSPDLLHWGQHRLVAERRTDSWDAIRIGAGAVPMKIDEGWLEIYHGVDPDRVATKIVVGGRDAPGSGELHAGIVQARSELGREAVTPHSRHRPSRAGG